MGTVDRDAQYLSQFLYFLMLHQLAPLESYPVILHPVVRSQLLDLSAELDLNSMTRAEFKQIIHRIIWTILSNPSDEFLRDDTKCPFTRFLIANHLQDGGAFARAAQITPRISLAQWCFRATAAQEVINIRGEFHGDSLL